ncbi:MULTISPECIES: fibronectin type III-like domain-contianing protein [unclassified Sphingobium]|nr:MULTISPECIES: fibronectin type III-like domain-contianing protein [unclassified Sphingobium]CAD7341018.1 Beta-xylosidase [Sphingobium sp. S8]CAD7342180.1 Beta-xylosidase [Sphingobium sp. S6]
MSTNSWLRTGDEVVQLYVRDEVSSVPRPVLKLCGFERVTLKPG